MSDEESSAASSQRVWFHVKVDTQCILMFPNPVPGALADKTAIAFFERDFEFPLAAVIFLGSHYD